MIDLTEHQLGEIAEDLIMGFKCYVHKQTLEVEKFPDPDKFYDLDEEMWGEPIKKGG